MKELVGEIKKKSTLENHKQSKMESWRRSGRIGHSPQNRTQPLLVHCAQHRVPKIESRKSCCSHPCPQPRSYETMCLRASKISSPVIKDTGSLVFRWLTTKKKKKKDKCLRWWVYQLAGLIVI